MNRLFLLVLAVAGFLSLPLFAADVDVFIQAGQSNSDGRGAATQLIGPLEKWAKPQADVLIAYSCSKLKGPQLRTDGFQPLQPGWSVAPAVRNKATLPTNTFGPELSFGRTLADRLPGRTIVLIKFTEGGTSLEKDWNPERKDRLYPAFLAFTRESLEALRQAGHTPTIRGMIWHQGESDAKLATEDYQARLTAFIIRVRKDLDVPNLPFGIGEVYDNSERDSIRAAQKAVTVAVPHTYLVTVEGLKTFDQGVHFDAAGQITLGERFATGMLKMLKAR